MLKTKVVILLLLLFVPQILWANSAHSRSNKPVPVELSNVRYAVNVDALTGDKKLRLVIDVTGPVQSSASLSSESASQLAINIKGASIGKLAGQLALDGSIANNISVSSVDGANSQLLINLPVPITGSDYQLFTLAKDQKANKPFRVVVDIKKPKPPAVFHFSPGLKNKVIAIDPGHGGTDPGAIGPCKIQEKKVTLDIALRVKKLLEQAGAKVYMTRFNDRDVCAPYASAVDELDARAMIGNKHKADIFLDIHANSFQDPKVGGTATYYYQKSIYDQLLAQSLQNSVITTGCLNDRGIQTANFFVLKHTDMPAALIELAFISNPTEEKLLNSPNFQQKLAQGILNGLDDFFAKAAKLEKIVK